MGPFADGEHVLLRVARAVLDVQKWCALAQFLDDLHGVAAAGVDPVGIDLKEDGLVELVG